MNPSDFTDYGLHPPLWGNVGSELSRMFPTDTGFSDALSSIGFWGGGGALQNALGAQMGQEEGRRKARTATDVANINANQAQNQAMMRLFEQVYGHLPLEYAKINQAGNIANMRSQVDLMNQMLGRQTGLEKAQIGANATLGAAERRAQATEKAAANRPPSVRKPPQEYLLPKINEIIQAGKAAGKTIDPASAALQAEREYEIARTGDKRALRQESPQENLAMGVMPSESISPDLMQSDPNAMSLMMGLPIQASNPLPTQQAAVNAPRMQQGSMTEPPLTGNLNPESVYRGTNPMARFVDPEMQAVQARVRDQWQAKPIEGYNVTPGPMGLNGRRESQVTPQYAQPISGSTAALQLYGLGQPTVKRAPSPTPEDMEAAQARQTAAANRKYQPLGWINEPAGRAGSGFIKNRGNGPSGYPGDMALGQSPASVARQLPADVLMQLYPYLQELGGFLREDLR